MNLRSMIVLPLMLAALMPAGAAAVERADTIHREFELGGATPSVLVDNVLGGVVVRAGRSGRVVVDIRRHVAARRDADLERGLREVVFAFRRGPGERLELGQDGPFRCNEWGNRRRERIGDCVHDKPGYEVSWQWTVEVPEEVALEVRSVSDGPVVVSGVTGAVFAHNVNGPVRLSGLGSAVDAETVNGGVIATFLRAPAGDSRLSTINGEIEIELPRSAGAEVGFESLNGDLYTDFDVESMPQRITPTSVADRRHRYRIERNTVVRLGDGGPRFDCHTINGDIVVRAR